MYVVCAYALSRVRVRSRVQVRVCDTISVNIVHTP